MIYGYKSNNDILTIIVAGSTIEELEKFYLEMSRGDVDNVREKELLSSLEMMMEDEFNHLPKPIMKVFHDSVEDQNSFIESHQITIVTDAQAISRQEEMIRNTTKKQEREDTAKEKLKAELLGETYVSPSIAEIYGLNIHDPWDTRTPEEKKQNFRNNDPNIMEETSFGDAETQRNARDAARREADPDYVPVRFMGEEHGKDEEDIDFNKILLQAKSKQTLDLISGNTEDDDTDEDTAEIDSPVEDTNIDPIYMDTELTKSILESMEEDYEDMLEYSKKKKSSYNANKSVKVKVSSLSSLISSKIKEICEQNGETPPEFIDEYWYSPASIIDGYYVLPQDSENINGSFTIVCGHNIDPSKSITISINGPTTRMIKKLYEDSSSTILYSALTETEANGKKKKIPTFFVVRLK